MTNNAILILFAATSCLRGQEAPPSPKIDKVEVVSRVFQLKYADPKRLATLLNRSGIGFDEQMKILVVNRPKSDIPEIEQFIQRFDVPPPAIQNIDITIYLISALGQPSTGAIPPELEAVIKQLRSMFSYKGFRLIDTQVLRVRPGQGAQASGIVEAGSEGEP